VFLFLGHVFRRPAYPGLTRLGRLANPARHTRPDFPPLNTADPLEWIRQAGELDPAFPATAEERPANDPWAQTSRAAPVRFVPPVDTAEFALGRSASGVLHVTALGPERGFDGLLAQNCWGGPFLSQSP
jgi:hypothetical protein